MSSTAEQAVQAADQARSAATACEAAFAAMVPPRVMAKNRALFSESVREELDYLRKQIAELAMERDVLICSAALFAKEAMGAVSKPGDADRCRAGTGTVGWAASVLSSVKPPADAMPRPARASAGARPGGA
jgi:PPE family